MAFDAAYEALTDHEDDARWAYGTGFVDPLAGVSTAVPAGVERTDLVAYCLMLGDDALVMSHRLQQWVTRAPEIEDELAIANIALDLLGQARLLLSRAGEVEGAGRDEDTLAYLRDAPEFRNVLLVERDDTDFAHLVARLLVFATWRLALLDRLATSRDPVLAAIGAKGVKEVTYHREYAAQWVVRLGDGTALSHERMQAAVEAVWPLVDELFRPEAIELRLVEAGVAVDPAGVRGEFDAIWRQVIEAATLRPADGVPAAGTAPASTSTSPSTSPSALASASTSAAGSGPTLDGSWKDLTTRGARSPQDPDDPDPGGGARGRAGAHTPALAGILAELQGLARSVPGGAW